MASPTYERLKLRNGLRVVLAPDRSAPVVAVAVYYDVGIRSEPQGRTGFAHLFEHLMFQGSASLGKMELVNQISSSGGVLNGSTRLDYTNYYEMLPSNALDRALFLEADRMGWPAVTEENLANQIAVVKEEIRVNVLNEPYGGFPWLTLAPVLYETWANAHDGYGSFEDLSQASLDDARDFFDAYYAPGNAVLAVTGDFEVDQAAELVHRHFDPVPKRAVPPRPDFDEPAPTSERRGEQKDDMAPAPAVALGWRVPDPADLDAYLPYVVVASALATGDASRLRRRLVQEDRLATDVGCHLGLMEDAFDVRNPCPFVLEAHHPGERHHRPGRRGGGRGARPPRHRRDRRRRARRASRPGCGRTCCRPTTTSSSGRCASRRTSSSAAAPSSPTSCPTCSSRSPPSRSPRRPGP